MRKQIATSLIALVLGAAGLAACGDDETTVTVTSSTPSTSSSTTSTTSTSSTTSTTSTEDTSTTSTESTTTENEDVSGNCDEAEHADDPECAAGGVGTDDDNSSGGTGPG